MPVKSHCVIPNLFYLVRHYDVLLFMYDTLKLKMTAAPYFETFMQIT